MQAESKDDAKNKDTLGNLDAILSSSQDEGQPAAQDEQPKMEDDVRALLLRLFFSSSLSLSLSLSSRQHTY